MRKNWPASAPDPSLDQADRNASPDRDHHSGRRHALACLAGGAALSCQRPFRHDRRRETALYRRSGRAGRRSPAHGFPPWGKRQCARSAGRLCAGAGRSCAACLCRPPRCRLFATRRAGNGGAGRAGKTCRRPDGPSQDRAGRHRRPLARRFDSSGTGGGSSRARRRPGADRACHPSLAGRGGYLVLQHRQFPDPWPRLCRDAGRALRPPSLSASGEVGFRTRSGCRQFRPALRHAPGASPGQFPAQCTGCRGAIPSCCPACAALPRDQGADRHRDRRQRRRGAGRNPFARPCPRYCRDRNSSGWSGPATRRPIPRPTGSSPKSKCSMQGCWQQPARCPRGHRSRQRRCAACWSTRACATERRR